MLNWAWAELCSRRAWQYSMMLAQTLGQRTAGSSHWRCRTDNPDYREKTFQCLSCGFCPKVSTPHLEYVKYKHANWEASTENTLYISSFTIYRITIKPVAWQPPSLLAVLLSLQVQRSQPVLATCPAHFLPDGRAETDTGAKKKKERDIATYANLTLKSRRRG